MKFDEKRMNRILRKRRMETKCLENEKKQRCNSSDVEKTEDFLFSVFQPEKFAGDSGSLLLAKRKSNRKDCFLVKHAYTDCACNEFVYTKLAQAMGYHMPDAVLFRLSDGEKRRYFDTEYIIGLRYLDFVNRFPTYQEIREQAKNWKEYFAFQALYQMFGEGDGIELPLAKDGLIYRVDTTDAFPLSNYQLDYAGINYEFQGKNVSEIIEQQIFSYNFATALCISGCEFGLEYCLKTDALCLPYYLEPFERMQEISEDYIDGFLNTLCYFYPDYIGEFFKRYITSIQQQAYSYFKAKR